MSADPMLPYQRGSDTSRAAAVSKLSDRDTERRRVWAEILKAGAEGLTDEEIADRLGMSGNTERPRRVELVRAGVVERSEAKRPTKSGRFASVWAARRGPEGAGQ
jgi:predicted ArsR family transcriptional regulator